MFGITVFGDSITFGRGNIFDAGWCDKLKEYFETKEYYNCLFNLGIPGDSTKDVLVRFDVEASARAKFFRKGDRQVIIFAIGINDSKGFIDGGFECDLDEFKKNISLLLKKAKKLTDEVVFIGLTPVDESKTKNYEGTVFSNSRIKSFNEAIKLICLENKVLFFDMFEEFSKFNYLALLDDGLHPNKEGYDCLFFLIKDFLIFNKIID